MIKKNLFLAVFFAAIGVILTVVFFRNVKPNEFIYIGDQFFRFNFREALINSFFIRKLEQLGVNNGWQFVTQVWDSIYYLLIYALGIPFQIGERILFFICVFLSLILSFMGFKEISKLLNFKISTLQIFIVCFWYCFNPYSLVLWHGGIYNLGTTLTYALSPLIFYYFHSSIFKTFNIKTITICAVLLFLASFIFWLYAVLIFFLIIYFVFYLSYHPKLIFSSIRNAFFLVLLYIPLSSFIIFSILYEYTHTIGNNNAVFQPTFGNQAGGLWYQFLMLFSWGIYTVWTPRSMYSFHSYYFSKAYTLSILSFYTLIFVGIGIQFRLKIKKIVLVITSSYKGKIKLQEKEKIVLIIILLFLVSIFFGKGPQPPLGQIFMFFYNHVPFFSVFRSADYRFGFSTVLALSVLLLSISKYISKYFLIGIILIIMFFQTPYFWNGKAITGENVPNMFYNRILYYPKDYTDLINFINRDPQSSLYILPIPPIEYGDYTLVANKHHIGQDILSKQIHSPFLYLSLSTGIYTNTYKNLLSALEKRSWETITQYPIKYILVRNDITCPTCNFPINKEIKAHFREVFHNNTFTLYVISKPTSYIEAKNIKLKVINPIKYELDIKNVKNGDFIKLNSSYSKDWKIYLADVHKTTCEGKLVTYNHFQECVENFRLFTGNELLYFFKTPLFESSHIESSTHTNIWAFDQNVLNKMNPSFFDRNSDGSYNLALTIYFLPQSWFYLTLLITATSFFICVLCLIIIKLRHNKYEGR